MKHWIINLCLSAIAVLAPIHTIMITVGVMLSIDLVTGIWKALKTKKKITSVGLSRTITKIIAYQLAIITGYLLETVFIGNLVPVSKIVGSFIALTEATSIFENISEITGVNFIKVFKESILKKDK